MQDILAAHTNPPGAPIPRTYQQTRTHSEMASLSPALHRAIVFFSVTGMISVSAYQVLSKKPKEEGHDALSSDKPAALRGEAPRDLAAEKRKVADADARAVRR